MGRWWARCCGRGNRNNWLRIKVVGTKSNRDGIGARMRVVSGPLVQMREVHNAFGYCSSSDLRANFGLGFRTKAELVEIRWSSGIVQTLKGVSANQMITFIEGQGPQ